MIIAQKNAIRTNNSLIKPCSGQLQFRRVFKFACSESYCSYIYGVIRLDLAVYIVSQLAWDVSELQLLSLSVTGWPGILLKPGSLPGFVCSTPPFYPEPIVRSPTITSIIHSLDHYAFPCPTVLTGAFGLHLVSTHMNSFTNPAKLPTRYSILSLHGHYSNTSVRSRMYALVTCLPANSALNSNARTLPVGIALHSVPPFLFVVLLTEDLLPAGSDDPVAGSHSCMGGTAAWEAELYGRHSCMGGTAVWKAQLHERHSCMRGTAVYGRYSCNMDASNQEPSFLWNYLDVGK